VPGKSIESQAREYVYDVKNCASEYGQSNLEGWEFSLVTDAEKIRIEKNYYPTVAAHPDQDSLPELFRLVKSKLVQPVNISAAGLDGNTSTSKEATHLIAFNPKLHR
jgi:hypothetical protein